MITVLDNMDYPKIKIEEIESIEFFPDYCSDGVWITVKPNPRGCHGASSLDELPFEFPQWFKNKVHAMQLAWDVFADSGSHEYTYGFTFKEDDMFFETCIKMIEADFRKLFPEHAHLLLES
jgi:hypothetical protein